MRQQDYSRTTPPRSADGQKINDQGKRSVNKPPKSPQPRETASFSGVNEQIHALGDHNRQYKNNRPHLRLCHPSFTLSRSLRAKRIGSRKAAPYTTMNNDGSLNSISPMTPISEQTIARNSSRSLINSFRIMRRCFSSCAAKAA
ncbi:hypothetical protein D3C76_1337620 [compost metagenome]